MLELILDVTIALMALVATLICGAPLIYRFCDRGSALTKMALSFVLGYVLLSLVGILAVLLEVDPFLLQMGMVLLGGALAIHYRDRFIGGLDGDDRLVLGMAALYLLMGLFIFDRIIIWMGGDAIAHASIIRMLLEGEKVPVSVYPFGSYWEYYPKSFHLYSSYWAGAFPVLNVIQTIPVLLSTITPLLLYSIVREMGRKNEAVYVFILACFVFSTHYSYLIWGGYPHLAAEMVLVASLLAILVDRRLLALFLPSILFNHTRMLALAGGALITWGAFARQGRHFPLILALGGGLIAALLLILPGVHPPEFLISVVTSQELASEYAARWYPAFLSLFGAAIALQRRDGLDRLALAWASSVIVITLLADTGPLSFVGSADRLMLTLYLPLSVLGASALSMMDGADRRRRASFISILLLTGAAGMGTVFFSYGGSWGLPQEDYDAIMWLSDQRISDPLLINLDETGAWAYPMTGIGVLWPRGVPQGYGIPGEDAYWLLETIVWDPNNESLLEEMKETGYEDIIIYISSVSISRPGHVPPFAEHHGAYPMVNLSFSEDHYDLLYDGGAKIFAVRRGLFSG